jgi:transcriptional regulator GlxA family with amidase domain
MTFTIGIHVFDQVEVLDFAGPYEVFTTASRMHRRTHDTDLFQVVTVARDTAPVRARAGLLVTPDTTFGTHPAFDVLVVPGGVVTDELARPDVAAWIARTAPTTRITASVCTGAFLLAQAGLVAGKAVTTHWEDIDDLKAMFPGLDVRTGVRWVDEGAIVTSAGISAGIDMSLHLVERLGGRALAERTARQLDVDWVENA